MLPANLIAATLGKLAVSDKPLITATPDKGSSQPALKLEIGQQVQGSVQAQVSPNVFQVRVSGQILQMQLPAFIRSGDLVSLQVVSLQPRLAFSLATTSNPVSTSEQLSSTSRLLSSLSHQPIERNYVRPAQQTPLWVAAPSAPDTTMLADKLHNALSHSGLFYESHQAQWIAGMRSIPQLMQEPQNQLSNKVVPTQILGDATFNTGTPNNTANVTPVIPEHLQNLVQQQLHTLENHQVLWQGLAWQGQEMRWEVREESPRRHANGEQDGQWITELNLNLPHLGNVSARLSFNGNAVSIDFGVSDEQTSNTLGKASAQLVSSLTERGIPVLQTRVKHTPGTPT